MKSTLKFALIVCTLVPFFGCAPKTDVDKANATIKAYMKTYVTSYKAISTKLDTCYSRIFYRQDVLQAAENVDKYKRKANNDWDDYASALSSRAIWEPVHSAFSMANWDRENTKVKESARSYIKNYGKYLEAWQFILDAYDNNDRNQVVGWWAEHVYKVNGITSYAHFLLSPDFTQVLACFSKEDEEENQRLWEVISDVIEDRDLLPEYKANFETFKAKNK